ncbi:MAG TPA: M14 family metallopeptidase [Candidatus Hydrogenedentes bacterium]|nr:M14 family metallopeptidase [Candidatus Hydrogenedentota bacterium]HPG66736.1 M14 family metallopeptidase [Candidatus Hydrogenedentota bacterium]
MDEGAVDFSHFLRYKELCRQIRDLARRRPDLAKVRSIGRTPEGRDILLLEITNPFTAPAEDKPVYLVHGNIHACELSGSACALYLARYLMVHAEDDAVVARLLERIAFHIIPRVSADGAEHVLTTQHPVRSREHWLKRKNCIWPEDINGDGHIHRMRVPDPNGLWFSPDEEPRLLTPRLPGEEGGRRYHVTTEGFIHDWDGGAWEDPATIPLDFNRNWAAQWRARHEQGGAGDYPFSEPEVRALADHILAAPNIFGVFGLHNGTNAILRPPTASGDDQVLAADMLAFRRLAALGSAITGFPPKAIHEYRNVLAQPLYLSGTFTEWGYRHRGLFAMEIELGNLYNGVGYDTERIFSLTPEDERQRDWDCLAWHDAHPEAGVFAEWQAVDHPQLGRVEVGGMLPEGLYNVVPGERPDVWEKTRRFICELAGRGPRLELSRVRVETLGERLFKVSCRVANEGSLPTHVTALGASLTHIDGVRVEIERRGEVVFVANRNRIEVGHLAASEYRDIEWVVQTAAGSGLSIVAHAPRAGRCEVDVTFDGHTGASETRGETI